MSRFHLGLLSGSTQRGMWIPPETVTAVGVMGGSLIDFSQAVFTHDVIRVVGLTFWGGVHVIVPPNVAVKQRGVALLGGFGGHGGVVSFGHGDTEGMHGEITIRLEGAAIMAGVTVIVNHRASPARLYSEEEAQELMARGPTAEMAQAAEEEEQRRRNHRPPPSDTHQRHHHHHQPRRREGSCGSKAQAFDPQDQLVVPDSGEAAKAFGNSAAPNNAPHLVSTASTSTQGSTGSVKVALAATVPTRTTKVFGAAEVEDELRSNELSKMSLGAQVPLVGTVVAPPPPATCPGYWTNRCTTLGFKHLTPVKEDVLRELQKMMDDTFKRVRTGDRQEQDMPSRLILRHAQRVEDSKLWAHYVQRRDVMAGRPRRCTPLAAMGGEVLTSASAAIVAGELETRANECLLWHGTSPHNAQGIVESGFKLDHAGSSTGTMYGHGIYAAECSSKSDEYARDDAKGIYKDLYCLLLCRVALGELLHMTVGGATTHSMIQAALSSGVYDSVLGDREASVGTYREFVVYQEEQMYPEFLLLYSRELDVRGVDAEAALSSN